MKFKFFLLKWQKVIRLAFTIGCLVGAGFVLYVGHALFQERIRLFFIFTGYVVVLTFVAIFFGRRLIAMITDG